MRKWHKKECFVCFRLFDKDSDEYYEHLASHTAKDWDLHVKMVLEREHRKMREQTFHCANCGRTMPLEEMEAHIRVGC